MTMSDRIAVFNHGVIEQLGAPEEIYERPRTSFVADFIGAANVLGARLLEASAGRLRLKLEDEVEVEIPHSGRPPVAAGENLRVAIRPERIRVRYDNDTPERPDSFRLKASLIENVYLGNASQIFLLPFSRPGKVLLAVSMDTHHQEKRPSGATVWADIRPQDILLLEPSGRNGQPERNA